MILCSYIGMSWKYSQRTIIIDFISLINTHTDRVCDGIIVNITPYFL